MTDDLIGKKFGKYTVIEYVYMPKMVLCRCDCGIERTVRVGRLISGATEQCLECFRKTRKKRTFKFLYPEESYD